MNKETRIYFLKLLLNSGWRAEINKENMLLHNSWKATVSLTPLEESLAAF